jgi:hypothetical protein
MKHFTKGVITGRITEIKDEETKGNKKYVTIQVDVSGTLSGDVTAYCRMYDKDGSIDELKRTWNRAKQGLFKLQGMYSQYQKDQSSPFLSSFTLYGFELLESGTKRAYFIVVGEVTSPPSGLNCGGQRFLVTVTKPGNAGQDQEDVFEFWAPGEKLLPAVTIGETVRVKGLIRQKEPDGVCGGDGPIRAYLESLEISQPVEEPTETEDTPS